MFQATDPTFSILEPLHIINTITTTGATNYVHAILV